MIGIRNVVKRFQTDRETVAALDRLTLDIEESSFFTLLGPSGCGKSTLLRCIAGLEIPDEGRISAGERVLFCSERGINVPPNKRRLGMVFQSYAIWPHMTVFDNVAFPLEAQRQPNIQARVAEALEMVGLGQLHDRYATKLSGGQQQRVALARAVVAEPDVLLLDEPLSNLDAALREQMRTELRRLHDTLRITTLYVTHDQAEALSMSDRIAVMKSGQFVEIAAPEVIYERPKSAFTAEFIGGANVIDGQVCGSVAAGTIVETPFGNLVTAGTPRSAGPVTLFIRPDKVQPVRDNTNLSEEANVLRGVLKTHHFIGGTRELELALPTAGGSEFILRCRAPTYFRATPGGPLVCSVDPADVFILEDEVVSSSSSSHPT